MTTRIDALDTPFAAIDLDIVERNLARAQRYFDEHKLALRPHIKTHKIPELARRQVELGASGITCQKIGEAEVMADAGIADILLTFNIVGPLKLRRLVELARRIRLSVVADSREVAAGLSAAMAEAGLTLTVLVECDTGLKRCGVQTPEQTLANGSGSFIHGFTYNAHPVCLAAGRAVLRRIRDQKLVAAAATNGEVGASLASELKKLSAAQAVGEVRGLGMLWGVEFVADRKTKKPFPMDLNFAGRVGQACAKRGLLVYPMQGCVDGYSGDHLLIAPPAIISAAQVRWAVEQCFEEGKTELGMAQYEVRKYTGWHHHMLLTMLAHFFLWHLKGRLGEKSTSADGVAAPPVIRSCVAPPCVYD